MNEQQFQQILNIQQAIASAATAAVMNSLWTGNPKGRPQQGQESANDSQSDSSPHDLRLCQQQPANHIMMSEDDVNIPQIQSPLALNLTTNHHNLNNQLTALKQQQQLNMLRRLNMLQQQQLNDFQQQNLTINFASDSGNIQFNNDSDHQSMIIDDNNIAGYSNDVDEVIVMQQGDDHHHHHHHHHLALNHLNLSHHHLIGDEKISANSIGPKNLKKLFIKRYRKSFVSLF